MSMTIHGDPARGAAAPRLNLEAPIGQQSEIGAAKASSPRCHLGATRLRAVAADIMQHLGEELTIAAVARRQRISGSYVRKLFQRQGTRYREFVLNQRLARAVAMLTEPSQADRTIASIAFEVGFGDLSYFNRTFRRRYSATPSDIRNSSKN